MHTSWFAVMTINLVNPFNCIEVKKLFINFCKKVKKDYFNQPMSLISTEEEKFKVATKCHICRKYFTEEDVRFRDHCLITGKYRGAAHNNCNINFRLTDDIPVIFHNLKRYDSHLLM